MRSSLNSATDDRCDWNRGRHEMKEKGREERKEAEGDTIEGRKKMQLEMK
jgi:hypothetical protein